MHIWQPSMILEVLIRPKACPNDLILAYNIHRYSWMWIFQLPRKPSLVKRLSALTSFALSIWPCCGGQVLPCQKKGWRPHCQIQYMLTARYRQKVRISQKVFDDPESCPRWRCIDNVLTRLGFPCSSVTCTRSGLCSAHLLQHANVFYYIQKRELW